MSTSGKPVELRLRNELEEAALEKRALSRSAALVILDPHVISLSDLLALAELPRRKHFGNRVQIHTLNNIQNGLCSEDCGYCAQRRGGPSEQIVRYTEKSEEEILQEAALAHQNGTFRYCLVSSGRAPGKRNLERLAGIVTKIKERYPMEVCLSAGMVTDPVEARLLARAGLDRYNHNLNTSAEHYGEICRTHEYRDRVNTLRTLSGEGVGLCSGVIVGMGENAVDTVAMACELRELKVSSIPVNFFIPVPGHNIRKTTALNAEFCLRVLALFRLMNPSAEIRLAAGRELYLGREQGNALRVANSLFVSGYLNVRGSDIRETLTLLLEGGYRPDVEQSDDSIILSELISEITSAGLNGEGKRSEPNLELKNSEELRPFIASRKHHG